MKLKKKKLDKNNKLNNQNKQVKKILYKTI